MQELNFTPTQTPILFIVLGLLGLLLSRSKPLIEINLPEDTQVQKEQERLSVLLNADLTSYKELLKGG
ncbi:TPA: hypothetical protein VLQ55_000446 [Streptococcus pyogenes]|uniref:hypothetical protein n=1 Tax=Streptococcus pyogenes TaxID=1314 RepID=UPI0010A0D545|nr:hypothetical protein [Streptococcus pyogenes]VHF26108.1 putative DNA-binding phage protein [Streptococcus pyogenes]HER6475365.1 hypothetical protein [Streptococcus pyogenes]HER6477132.1 hypothetical protein [Streptococcus pyogenes]HER6480604.1 hypothetical protein [Streptococcus pyogenes]HER6484087.1 hypothetical protein [Streptococcus pyogenes]